MATFLQIVAMLMGVGILGFLAFKLMSHEYMIKKSTAKTDQMIVSTYESVSKSLDDYLKLQKGNSELLLLIEDLKREIQDREL